MTKEPENVLEHYRIATARGTKERGSKMTVSQKHGHRTCENRHRSDQQESRNDPGPNKKRHLHQGHPWRPHIEYGRNNVYSAQYGGHTEDVNSEDR